MKMNLKNIKIQKLNKKLIYGCLLGAALVSIPLMIVPMSLGKKSSNKKHQENPSQVASITEDAYAISGMERFPKSYDKVKDFEAKTAEITMPNSAVLEEDDLAKGLAELAKLDGEEKVVYQKAKPGARYHDEEDPWAEARLAERRRQAFEHYEARRSDILFARAKTSKENQGRPNLESFNHEQVDDDNGLFFARNQKENIGVITDAKPFSLSQGTLIPAVLLSEINTSLPGPILARVSQNIWDSKSGQALLIPQNSTIIGEYQSSVGPGQNRAQIVWSRIIFPNQQSVNLGAMVGLDKKGISGASGSVDNHYDKMALSLLMTTALGAGVRLTQGRYDPNSASIAGEMGNALAQETMRLGNKITDRALAVPPTITVPMGKRLNVFVEQDLNLKPYQG